MGGGQEKETLKGEGYRAAIHGTGGAPHHKGRERCAAHSFFSHLVTEGTKVTTLMWRDSRFVFVKSRFYAM